MSKIMQAPRFVRPLNWIEFRVVERAFAFAFAREKVWLREERRRILICAALAQIHSNDSHGIHAKRAHFSPMICRLIAQFNHVIICNARLLRALKRAQTKERKTNRASGRALGGPLVMGADYDEKSQRLSWSRLRHLIRSNSSLCPIIISPSPLVGAGAVLTCKNGANFASGAKFGSRLNPVARKGREKRRHL